MDQTVIGALIGVVGLVIAVLIAEFVRRLGLPEVTHHPQDQVVDEGQPVRFIAHARGWPGLSARWEVRCGDDSEYSPIEGACSFTYTFTATKGQDGNDYRAVFMTWWGFVKVRTLPALLTVQATLPLTEPVGRALGLIEANTANSTANDISEQVPERVSRQLVITDTGLAHDNQPENTWLATGVNYTLETEPPDRRVRFHLRHSQHFPGGRGWCFSSPMKVPQLLNQLGRPLTPPPSKENRIVLNVTIIQTVDANPEEKARVE